MSEMSLTRQNLRLLINIFRRRFYTYLLKVNGMDRMDQSPEQCSGAVFGPSNSHLKYVLLRFYVSI